MQDILGIERPCCDEVVISKCASHNDDLVFHQQMPKFSKCLAEQAEFHATTVVVEYDADAVAAFADVDDETGDSNFAARLCVITLSL